MVQLFSKLGTTIRPLHEICKNDNTISQCVAIHSHIHPSYRRHALTMSATNGTTAKPLAMLQSIKDEPTFVRPTVQQEIVRHVVRQKLRKQRHAVLEKAIDPDYLDELFPKLLEFFKPQTVFYNGGIAKVPEWKISCYLEVMDGGVPTTDPNLTLKAHFEPLLEACNDIFLFWYRQQHACNKAGQRSVKKCHRLMTFVTRYTPNPGEQALLKVSCCLLVAFCFIFPKK